MSGSDPDRAPAAPIDFTEEEVRLLAGRRAKPVAAVARLKKLVPTEPIGRLASDAAQPARLTRKELPLMRRAGRRPSKLQERLTPSEVPAEPYEVREDQRAGEPRKKPPLAGK
jgi:hypothetical protein